MYTNLAVSAPVLSGVLSGRCGPWRRVVVQRDEHAPAIRWRCALQAPFLLLSQAGLQGWGGLEKGQTEAKGVPQSHLHPDSSQPLSMGPRLPWLCPNRKVLANAEWEGRCGAF